MALVLPKTPVVLSDLFPVHLLLCLIYELNIGTHMETRRELGYLCGSKYLLTCPLRVPRTYPHRQRTARYHALRPEPIPH